MQKTVIFASAAAAALALAAFAAPASAQEVHIKNAVARVAVVVEDRPDVAVEIEQGSSGLPAIKVSRRNGEVIIDGDLGGRAIRNCNSGPADAAQPGQGATVEVRDHGTINIANAPLIVIRSPRTVDVGGGGAVFGSVGRGATSVSVGTAGCGGWTVANVDGPLAISVAGSGGVRAGTSHSLEVSVAGSGDVAVGGTGAAEVSIAGSGDVNIAAVSGNFESSIAGSGDVIVRGGRADRFEASVMGAGDIDFRGAAGAVEVNLLGGGDIRIASASGPVERNIMGGGRLTIGNQ